jgi:hypothetical protein
MIIQRPVTVTEAFLDVRYPEFKENPEKRKEYKSQVVGLLAEVVEKVDLVSYVDVERAVMKALE